MGSSTGNEFACSQKTFQLKLIYYGCGQSNIDGNETAYNERKLHFDVGDVDVFEMKNF